MNWTAVAVIAIVATTIVTIAKTPNRCIAIEYPAPIATPQR
ncbi:MAG: hypothetical protein AAF773_01580 [Cyanobacteria bacterium P01_D01_bin.115]